ncbi:MAG: ABC transporter substrate-binding protein, partial [Bacteroidota bacterium]
MNRLTKYLSFVVFVVFFISACYSKRNNGNNIFHYNETTGIASLDPAFAKNQAIMWAAHQLYNTLVEVNDHLEMVPSLAKRWDISPDRLTYTFHLRNDVFF